MLNEEQIWNFVDAKKADFIALSDRVLRHLKRFTMNMHQWPNMWRRCRQRGLLLQRAFAACQPR